LSEDKDIAPGAKELSRFVDMSVEALVLQNLEIKIMKEQSLERRQENIDGVARFLRRNYHVEQNYACMVQ
jgi:hypothetical protein